MGKLRIIKITTDNEITVHNYPEGGLLRQNKALRALISEDCCLYEHVRPERLYKDFRIPRKAQKWKGSTAGMLVDEEGYYNDPERNAIATWLCGSDIVGNALIVGEYEDRDGDLAFSGISEDHFSWLYAQLQKLERIANGAADPDNAGGGADEES